LGIRKGKKERAEVGSSRMINQIEDVVRKMESERWTDRLMPMHPAAGKFVLNFEIRHSRASIAKLPRQKGLLFIFLTPFF
jgi:hypothetical protein